MIWVCHETLHMYQWQISIQVFWKWDNLGMKKPKEKGTFISDGPNWVMSLDARDKRMDFQKNTFPITIYGSIDTASRKLLWIKVWVTNRISVLVARWYFEFIYETRVMPNYIRIEKDTKTGTIAKMHCFLRS